MPIFTFPIVNPLTAKGLFFGHTYNYVDCHRATFRPLVWREILNFLCYGITYRKRICRKSFSIRIQHLALHLADYILCYGTKFECTVRGNCRWEPLCFLMQRHQCDNVLQQTRIATCDVAKQIATSYRAAAQGDQVSGIFLAGKARKSEIIFHSPEICKNLADFLHFMYILRIFTYILW